MMAEFDNTSSTSTSAYPSRLPMITSASQRFEVATNCGRAIPTEAPRLCLRLTDDD